MRSDARRPLLAALPALSDWIFIAVLAWLLGYALTGMDLGLLSDASTGCHIRTGDFVLAHHQAPRTDMLSFTRAGQPWFAWEWLSDALFALLYRALALKGVVVFSGALIALTVWFAARHAIQRGANCLIVIALLHVLIGASSSHYLARPQLFTFFFCAVAFRLIDADLGKRSRWIWSLVPLTVLWTNLHPGFFVLILSAAIIAAGRFCEAAFNSDSRKTRLIDAARYAGLAAACLLVSGLNPYGFASHRHIIELIQAPWVSNLVEEFRPPDFHSASGMYCEILLFAGLAVAVRFIRRGELARALLILAWAHASLLSIRSVPIYGLLVFPLAAAAASELLEQSASDPFGILSALRAIGRDYRNLQGRPSPWPAVAFMAALALCLWTPQIDFPDGHYPIGLVTREARLLASSRVFSTDSWSDYLTYRFYPQSRIFMDGRNDFFGEDFAQQYLDILNARNGWDNVLRKYGADVALIPVASPLAAVLGQSRDWKTIERDDGAVLAVRIASPVSPPAGTAQPRPGT